MASRKEYIYQIKGKKLSLIESDSITSDGLNYTFSGVSGDGLLDGTSSGSTAWKSPITSVTEGIEIEYVYSPQYTVASTSSPQINKFYINGWTVIDGYLTLLRSHSAAVADWTGAPYSTVTSGTEGDTGGQSLDYIVVQGSNRWNGLHKVQTAGADGTLKTYTKVNKTVARVEGSSNINIAPEDSEDKAYISSNNGTNIWLNAIFSAEEYIFVNGSATGKNNGFWQIHSVGDDSSDENSSVIYVKNRYYCYDSDNTLSTEGEDTTADTTTQASASINIYKAYRDFSYILTDINVLNDENDTIDLPSYLNKALVYYVKGRMAEDTMNLELKEYMMKEFRKMVEKHESGKIWGSRQIMAGPNAIR